MNVKNYTWTIPFLLSIICGILNPYGGLISIVAVVLSFGLLIFFQSDIGREINALNKAFNTNRAVASDLSVTNWVMTAFTFAVLNVIMNLFAFWFCYQGLMEANTLPHIGFTVNVFGANEWTAACVLYALTVAFHIAGTIMIFVRGIAIKKQYAALN